VEKQLLPARKFLLHLCFFNLFLGLRCHRETKIVDHLVAVQGQ